MNQTRPRWGQLHIPHWSLRAGHRLATGLALVVVAFLALDQRYGWLRHSPGGEAFDLNEQPFFLALFALGVILALRWRLVGGALAVFTSASLIVFASRQLRPVDAAIVLVGFLLPAVVWVVVGLFELRDEQFHRSPDEQPRPLLLPARCARGHDGFRGRLSSAGVRRRPMALRSPLRTDASRHRPSPPSDGSSTRWVWSGAVTARSASRSPLASKTTTPRRCSCSSVRSESLQRERDTDRGLYQGRGTWSGSTSATSNRAPSTTTPSSSRV